MRAEEISMHSPSQDDTKPVHRGSVAAWAAGEPEVSVNRLVLCVFAAYEPMSRA